MWRKRGRLQPVPTGPGMTTGGGRSDLVNQNRAHRGFVLVEAVAIAAVVGLLVALLCVMAGGSRRLGRVGDDVSHLKLLGSLTGQFAADNADRFWTFSWRHGETHQTQYPDLNNAADDLQAAANQAVYIMRTKGGLPNMPVINSWIPHIGYSNLVLADYANAGLPSLNMVSSGDTYRRRWEQDRTGFFQGAYLPYQPDRSEERRVGK